MLAPFARLEAVRCGTSSAVSLGSAAVAVTTKAACGRAEIKAIVSIAVATSVVPEVFPLNATAGGACRAPVATALRTLTRATTPSTYGPIITASADAAYEAGELACTPA